MAAQYKSKVFKAGNSAAVRLPKDVAFALGTAITIERRGDEVVIRCQQDSDSVRRGLEEMAAELDAIWAAAPFREVEQRHQPIAPDRPGLY
ncbi:antitoxin [Sphingomonas sp.]|uniref:antitoxin n=1 Tax=Sphingomonas sp. TaxID=28214 RepID=UPI003CC5434F